MPTPPDVTPELWQLLLARDDSALSALIDQHTPMMTGLARAVAGREAAEEVVQDAWVSALEALETFQGRSTLKTWLGQIVLNRARTAAKTAGRTVPITEVAESAAEVDALVARDGNWLSPQARWSQPADVLVQDRQVQAAIAAALEQLPEAQRLAVVLRDLEGASPEEACHILGVSESNHRQLLHRGRLRLRAALEGFGR